MISLEHVTKSFMLKNHQKKVVLDDISYIFKEGVNTGICGLNGAGKSTLLKLLCGSSFPTSGKIVRTSSISWPVAFAGCVAGSLSGYQNLRFISRIYNSDYKRDKAFVEEFTELGDYLYEPVKTYSSGMKSKLAFALSMTIGFDFYLIDEAFSVGDATFRQKSVDLFKEKSKNSTLILISHSMGSVQQMCQKGLILENGKLIEHATLKESVEHYLALSRRR